MKRCCNLFERKLMVMGKATILFTPQKLKTRKEEVSYAYIFRLTSPAGENHISMGYRANLNVESLTTSLLYATWTILHPHCKWKKFLSFHRRGIVVHESLYLIIGSIKWLSIQMSQKSSFLYLVAEIFEYNKWVTTADLRSAHCWCTIISFKKVEPPGKVKRRWLYGWLITLDYLSQCCRSISNYVINTPLAKSYLYRRWGLGLDDE